MALVDKPHYRNVYKSVLHGGIFLGGPVPTRADAEQVCQPTGVRPIYRVRVIPHPVEKKVEVFEPKGSPVFATIGAGVITVLILALGYMAYGVFSG